jgi:hypothetical protein
MPVPMLPPPPPDTRMAELDQLIAAGYEDARPDEIPADWPKRKAPRAATRDQRRRRARQVNRAWKSRWKWGRPTVNGRAKGAA